MSMFWGLGYDGMATSGFLFSEKYGKYLNQNQLKLVFIHLRLSKLSIMSTLERRRMIKVEIRGLPEARHMQMYISEKMNRVGDLAKKLKHVYNKDIGKTDEIKIYRDKFHLPDHENINIIETGEEIIAYRRESEYVEEQDAVF